MAFAFLPSSLFAIAAVSLPHIALAHYFGFSLSLGTIPEPLLSLLLLALISSFTLVFLKPIVLDLAISSSPTSKTRSVASWASSNVQWIAFALLWHEILGQRWPCPRDRSPEYHQELIWNWRLGSGEFAVVAFVILNLYHGGSYPSNPSTDPANVSVPSPQPEKTEEPAVEVETAKE
ncbi:hypothetical protein BDY24DRAFT_393672 [Mrakia frigida]|uniref:uncharacterized protein n=1 Tax=Mrakia frigida TaxID=29902 RepID=UPI003FCC160D